MQPVPDMDSHTPEKMKEACRPIASLIGKSEKALGKLAPGTWQHAMLRDNLKVLRLSIAFMGKDAGGTVHCAREDLREALRALGSMIGRTEKSGAKFQPGTSHHALQRNRLEALRIAEGLIKAEWDGNRGCEDSQIRPVQMER